MLPPRTAFAALVLCALPLAALTACSSGSAGSAGASSGSVSSLATASSAAPVSTVQRPKDVCALLSTAEATTSMRTAIATTYKSDSACGYSGEDLHFDVSLVPTAIDSLSTEESLLKLDVGTLASVSGVGDQAVGNRNGIAFQKGSVIMTVETEPGTTRTTPDELVATAKTIVSHLG